MCVEFGKMEIHSYDVYVLHHYYQWLSECLEYKALTCRLGVAPTQ